MQHSFIHNNIGSDTILTDSEYRWFKKQSIAIPVRLADVINHLIALTSRYYFQSSILYLDDSCDKLRKYDKRFVTVLQEELILLVQPHNRIIILSKDAYCRFNRFHRYMFTPLAIESYYPQLDKIAIGAPVIWIPNPHNTKVFFSISAWAIVCHIHESSYFIPRNVFEMLYAESEDFAPSDSDELIIRTQLRHQLYWKDYYLTDLLRTDVAIIIDTQNQLRKELRDIANSNDGDMNRKIIGVHGLKGAGKDTLVTFIKMHLISYTEGIYLQPTAQQHLYNTAIKNINDSSWMLASLNLSIERFAEPLKTCISGFLDIDVDELNNQDVKSMQLDPSIWHTITGDPLTIRDLHTRIADAIKNAINPDIFATSCIERINANDKKELFIVNDVRFPNELDILQNNGAYCVKITRGQHNTQQPVHASEQGLPSDKFDYLIRNDGSYEELSLKVAEMLLDLGLVSNEYVKLLKQ